MVSVATILPPLWPWDQRKNLTLSKTHNCGKTRQCQNNAVGAQHNQSTTFRPQLPAWYKSREKQNTLQSLSGLFGAFATRLLQVVPDVFGEGKANE